MRFKFSEDDGNASAENQNAKSPELGNKVDFMSPAEVDNARRQAAMEQQAQSAKKSIAANIDEQQSKLIDSINSAVDNKNSKWDDVEDVSLTDEESKVLEQILFTGSATFDIPIGFMNRKVTVMSQSPLDHEIIEVCMKRFITTATIMDKKTKDEVDNAASLLITEGALMSRRQMYTMALYVVGFDGKDFCKDEYKHFSVKVLKAAYKKALALLNAGEISKYLELLSTIIEGVNYRVGVIMEWGNIMIDAINERKYEYETRLFSSLDKKRDKAIPKY